MPLDNINNIRKFDKNDMISNIINLPKHINDSYHEVEQIQIPNDYFKCNNIVIVGMGGSGIPGDYINTLYYSECSVPIIVHKNYGLPPFANQNTLVLAVSYSGTTEETIDAFQEALRNDCKIVGISGGDKLLEMLKAKNLPYYAPPSGFTTRACLGYLLFPLIKILEKLGFINEQKERVLSTVLLLKKLSKLYEPSVPFQDNLAKQIATKIQNTYPAIYSSIGQTDVVGLRWKHQLNENSKIFTQLENFPDSTHNHLAAIGNSRIEKTYCAIFLRNLNEKKELKIRIDAMEKILENNKSIVIENVAEEPFIMENLLSQSYLGDFVSFYLAILNEEDPTPTPPMSDLKRILGLTDLSP